MATVKNMMVQGVIGKGNANNNSQYQGYGNVEVTKGSVHKAIPSKSFEEMLMSAKNSFKQENDTPQFKATGDVLKQLETFEDMSVEYRMMAIDAAYKNKELEAILGVSSDYYRDKYFALLKIVAMNFNVD